MDIEILIINLENSFLNEFKIYCKGENWNLIYDNKMIQKADYILIDTLNTDHIKKLRNLTERPIILLNDNLSQYEKLLLFENGIDFHFNYPKALDFTWQLKALKNMEDRLFKKVEQIIYIGDFQIDILTGEIKLFEKTLNLTKTEREIFINILNNKGQIVSRKDLADGSRSVDVHIRRIRKKLEDITNKKYILTERNKGYYFNPGEL